MAPTRTLAPALALTRLLPRQMPTQSSQPTSTVVVSTNAGSGSNPDLDGGAIAGIVIGTVVGVLLLWWIIRTCAASRSTRPDRAQGWYDDDDTAPSGSRSRSRSSHGRRRRRHHRYHHHTGRHHHGSGGRRPVVVEEKVGYDYAAPRRPSATYVYAPAQGGSGSRSQGRYYVSG